MHRSYSNLSHRNNHGNFMPQNIVNVKHKARNMDINISQDLGLNPQVNQTLNISTYNTNGLSRSNLMTEIP